MVQYDGSRQALDEYRLQLNRRGRTFQLAISLFHLHAHVAFSARPLLAPAPLAKHLAGMEHPPARIASFSATRHPQSRAWRPVSPGWGAASSPRRRPSTRGWSWRVWTAGTPSSSRASTTTTRGPGFTPRPSRAAATASSRPRSTAATREGWWTGPTGAGTSPPSSTCRPRAGPGRACASRGCPRWPSTPPTAPRPLRSAACVTTAQASPATARAPTPAAARSRTGSRRRRTWASTTPPPPPRPRGRAPPRSTSRSTRPRAKLQSRPACAAPRRRARGDG
mmetsp:Transcript_27442/g.72446  ORF Transcript_27442/g.72446 Transcript_27442/m.72446 type:complete len:280 (+) Transcript_27442:99-938(+)